MNANTKNYNKVGNISESNEKYFAQSHEIDLGKNDKQFKYLIATYNNVPYDPNGIDSHRESSLDIKLKPVSKEAFDYYILYLQTKNGLYMTRTQRSFING